jgi:hypothetical protein
MRGCVWIQETKKKAMEEFPAAVGWGAPSLKPEFPQNFFKERIGKLTSNDNNDDKKKKMVR